MLFLLFTFLMRIKTYENSALVNQRTLLVFALADRTKPVLVHIKSYLFSLLLKSCQKSTWKWCKVHLAMVLLHPWRHRVSGLMHTGPFSPFSNTLETPRSASKKSKKTKKSADPEGHGEKRKKKKEKKKKVNKSSSVPGQISLNKSRHF